MSDDIRTYSINEASKIIGIGEDKISNEIKQGRLKVFKLPVMAHPRIPHEALRKWLEENTGVLNG